LLDGYPGEKLRMICDSQTVLPAYSGYVWTYRDHPKDLPPKEGAYV
jgi:hypothetical protein